MPKKLRNQTTFVNLSTFQRDAGRVGNVNKPIKKLKTNQDKKVAKIKEVANGCWWIEQYLMSDLTTPKSTTGLGDE